MNAYGQAHDHTASCQAMTETRYSPLGQAEKLGQSHHYVLPPKRGLMVRTARGIAGKLTSKGRHGPAVCVTVE